MKGLGIGLITGGMGAEEAVVEVMKKTREFGVFCGPRASIIVIDWLKSDKKSQFVKGKTGSVRCRSIKI